MIKININEVEHTISNSLFKFYEEEREIGSTNVEIGKFGPTILFDIEGQKYELSYEHNKGVRYYNIVDNFGNCIGSMEKKIKKLGFFKGSYYYTYIKFNNKNFHIYEVGKGKEGMHFPCHIQLDNDVEEQVALVVKSSVKYDYKDTYECYVKNIEDKVMMILYTIYKDYWGFRNAYKVSKNSRYTSLVYTRKKELLAKCKIDFLETK